MHEEYSPPLSLHFIWNPSDGAIVEPLLENIQKYFSRDVNNPFSRNLNIPIFFYSSDSAETVPLGYPEELCLKNVVFIFTSENTLGNDIWFEYLSGYHFSKKISVVPIALDSSGLMLSELGVYKSINFLRFYEWPSHNLELYATLMIAHEVFRFGVSQVEENKPGVSSSIKLFLSHSKSDETGKLFAQKIKSFIDDTNLKQFFDATEISPGFKFGEEIICHIKDSTIVAIGSDTYSSRYWCQREILSAKENQRPMIAVNCMVDREDRIFPAASNVPHIRISSLSPSEEDVLKTLNVALQETIRHYHSISSLEHYKLNGWIHADSHISPRPPEVRQLIKVKNLGGNKVCYPEPPIYQEEGDWHSSFDIEAFTPLWTPAECATLKEIRVGVSLSEPTYTSFETQHLPNGQIKRLAQDIARHLLARQATLVYGGDLRKDGFTEFILDEAVALKNRINSDEIYVENHLAWPLYCSTEEIISWRAKYRKVMKTHTHKIPSDIVSEVDRNIFIRPDSTKNKYYWSRCLSEMRLFSIENTNFRIFSGGKFCNYSGKMPGVLEELLFSLAMGKPVYLLGGFGGIVEEICKVVRGDSYPEVLSEKWQYENNEGYDELQKYAITHGHNADYAEIKETLSKLSISLLAYESGLDEKEYLRLMRSPFIDECIYLVLKGINKKRAHVQ